MDKKELLHTNENKTGQDTSSQLKELLRFYNTIFSDCLSIEDIINKYVDTHSPERLLNALEIEVLYYYLQYKSTLKNKILTNESIVQLIKERTTFNKISGNYSGLNTSSKESLDDKDFAVFEGKEEKGTTTYSPLKISDAQKTANKSIALFAEMRKIVMNKNVFYDSEEDLFLKQGKLMINFSDDYTGNAPFEHYTPIYENMNNNQLRTYFTWRTKVRNKEIMETSYSYVFVYIYELINNIGVKNPSEGLESLIWLLKNYSSFSNTIEQYLVDWIRDYYICNQFDMPFINIIEKYELEGYYPFIRMPSDRKELSFDELCDVSKYKIKDSRFFTENTQEYILHCLERVFLNLKPLLSLYGTDFNQMLSISATTLVLWKSFRGAVYKKPKVQRKAIDKTVILSPHETYRLKDGTWSLHKSLSIPSDNYSILNYIMKNVEGILRQLTDYKYKLKSNGSDFREYVKHSHDIPSNIKTLLLDPLFDQIITETTTVEFSAFSTECDTAELTSIIQGLNGDAKNEPYATFIKMRGPETFAGRIINTKSFHTQALMLKDLTDEFEHDILFESYSGSTYDDMTNDQLRCYVTWRSKVWLGEFPKIDAPYIRLYMFEIVNNLDGIEEEKVIEKMAVLLKQYPNLTERFAHLTTDIIKDYYLCSNLGIPFYDVLKKFDIVKFYPSVAINFLTDFDFDLYLSISKYKVDKSVFYTEKTAPIIKECCEYVFKVVNAYFSQNEVSLNKIILKKQRCGNWWRPFIGVPYAKKPAKDKKVVICTNEIYVYQNDEWNCKSISEITTTGEVLIGYIFKRIEVKMRTLYQFKYKLTAEVSSIKKKIVGKHIATLIQNPDFDKTIDDAVAEYFEQNYSRIFPESLTAFEKPVEIKIDMSKLHKIREDANIIREKLTIEDDMNADESLEEQNTVTLIKEVKTEPQKHFDNPVKAFCDSLTEIQRQSLMILANGESNMTALASFAEKNQIMLEVLLEDINELAIDIIGDNIIETADVNLFIYDEYLEELKLELERLK